MSTFTAAARVVRLTLPVVSLGSLLLGLLLISVGIPLQTASG